MTGLDGLIKEPTNQIYKNGRKYKEWTPEAQDNIKRIMDYFPIKVRGEQDAAVLRTKAIKLARQAVSLVGYSDELYDYIFEVCKILDSVYGIENWSGTQWVIFTPDCMPLLNKWFRGKWEYVDSRYAGTSYLKVKKKDFIQIISDRQSKIKPKLEYFIRVYCNARVR